MGIISAENGATFAAIAECDVATIIIPNYGMIENLCTTAHAAGAWSLLLQQVAHKGTFVLRGTEILRVTPALPAVIDLTVDSDDEHDHVRVKTPERENDSQPVPVPDTSAEVPQPGHNNADQEEVKSD